MTYVTLPESLTLRWAALSPRERLLITVAAVVLVAMVLLVAVWQPLRTAQTDELDRIARYDRMLLALSQLPDGGAPVSDLRPIATIIAQTAEAQGLVIQRLDTPAPDAAGPDIATVSLQDVSFETLVLWIDGLGRNSGLIVNSAMVRRTEVPGTVAAELSLQRATP